MINTIYLIVAFLTFCVFLMTLEEKDAWKKQIHLGMKIIFFISNVAGLILINKNPYYEALSDKKFLFYLMYLIPIGVYVVQFVCYLLRKEINDIVLPFMIYIFLLLIFVLYQPSIYKGQVIKNEGDITSYKEMIVRSTFINDTIEGKDYIIKYKDEKGKEKEEIIKTRAYYDSNIVEIYPHQEEAYFEKYVTVEESISFFGNINEEVLDGVTYKLYLTDDMYE